MIEKLEFGKAAAQIFFLERATIVCAQGASEDKKFAAEPTQPNSNFSIIFGIDFYVGSFSKAGVLGETM